VGERKSLPIKRKSW